MSTELTASLLLLLPLSALPSCVDRAVEDWSCQEWDTLFAGSGADLAAGLECVGYNKHIGPEMYPSPDGEQDVGVAASISVTHIHKLDDISEIFELSFWLMWVWKDHRLPIPAECVANQTRKDGDGEPGYFLDGEMVEAALWMPPIDLEGAIELNVNRGFTLDNGGQALAEGQFVMVRRYHAKLKCPMNFALFPFDSQRCEFRLFLRNGKNRTMQWSDLFKTDTEELAAKNWRLDSAAQREFDHTSMTGEAAQGLLMLFKFDRVWTYHVMQTILPSELIMLCAVFSVFIPLDPIPGRMGLCVTSFLSMIALFNGARDDWPSSTGEMKAIDYWSVICYSMVFLPLASFCLVLFLRQRYQAKMNKVSAQSTPTFGGLPPDNWSDKTERVARIVMPAMFILLNLIFGIGVSASV